MSTVSLNRTEWLDVAKGIAIMLVVIGHSASFDVSPIYWFHMPAFFMISGYLFKPQDRIPSLKAWMIKRAKQLFVPYLFFLLLITSLRYLFLLYNSELTFHSFREDFLDIMIGGRFFPSDFYMVMWFIPCIYLTQVTFAAIHFFIKSNAARFAIISLCYVLAHIEAWFLLENKLNYVPWNLDVALLAIFYYAFGYFVKRVIIYNQNKRNKLKITMIGILAAAIFITTIYVQGDYLFNMRSVVYTHFFLDLNVPITLSILLLILSWGISKLGHFFGIINYIGRSSLIIMYTHVPIKLVYEHFFQTNNMMIVILGIILPLLVSTFILEKSPLLSYLALGRTDTSFPFLTSPVKKLGFSLK
ncbi:acyltransferase family protein [Bacillus sp. CGMCC 1.16607]|uniref:acyltransferase family protein n=1 Tax=Bacillus sp. CGMCC 1.16607 TaxID=3351842 RepID=UPI00363E5E76